MRKYSVLVAFLLSAGCGSDDPVRQVVMGPTNLAPVMHVQGDTTAVVGDTLRIWAQATDPDGDTLSYRSATVGTLSDYIQRGYPDTDLDAVSGQFVFRVKSKDRPDRVFRIYADDGNGGLDSTQFTVNVN